MEGPDSGSGKYSGYTKYQVSHALHSDWQDLADIVGVPVAYRERFERGRQPQAIWDWLDARKRLHELRAAFEKMGRDDLVKILDADGLTN